MESQRIKVGVLLDRRLDDLGEWFADATAFEAAGADLLWVGSLADSGLDPMAVLAALAARSSRSLLVGELSASDRPLAELVRTLETIIRLSQARLALIADADWPAELTTVVGDLGISRYVPDGQDRYEHRRDGERVERWARTVSPESRAAWRAALANAAEDGVDGLLVPAGPRLLDILRNPNDPGGRDDLHLAQG
jgi:hypothetical protein